MATGTASRGRAPSPAGSVLQTWRRHRRMSQLDLSVASGVTARHISFVETGRSQPGTEMLRRLADALEMPLRDRNDLFLAAGYAPPHRDLALDDEHLADVDAAIRRILSSHEPLPAVVMDRHWNLVRTNQGAIDLFGSMIDLSDVDRPANVLRMMFSPTQLRPYVTNWEELAPELVARARRESVTGVPDATLSALLDELEGQLDHAALPSPPSFTPVIRVTFEIEGHLRSYFSTVTTVGSPNEVTIQELRIELFHPTEQPQPRHVHSVPP